MSIEEAIESLNSPEQFATTQFYNIKNNCASVLNATIDAIQTSLVLVAGGGALFPAAPFYISCEFEVMKCTGKSTDTFTVTRGFDGTTAAAHTAGVIIEQRNNAALWTDLQLAVNNIESGATQVPFTPPNGSIGNAILAADVARPNMLQNGGFEQWSRGPGPFTVNGAIIADSWFISGLSSGTMSVSRDSANADVGSQYCAAAVYVRTAVNVDITQAGTLLSPQLRGQTVTFAFRIKTNVANAVRLRANDAITGAQFSSYHSGNNTYQTVTLTYPIALAATTLNIAVEFDVSCTAYIDNATLTIGTQADNYFPAQVPDIIPNANVGPDFPRQNLLLNGDFSIWQRGNGPFSGATSSRVYTADRWAWVQGGGVTTISRDTSNTDGSNSAAVAVITITSGGSGDLRQELSGISGSENVTYNIRGKTVAVSARVKSTVANSIRINLSDNISPAASSQYHSGGGAYETLTAVLDCSTGAGLLTVSFSITANGNYWVGKTMLVYGSTPTNYAGSHPADELARCMRYYEPLADGALGNPYIFGGYNGATASYYFYMPFKVRKAITPTITKNGTWTVFNAAQPSASGASPDGASMSAAITSTGYGYVQCGAAGQSWIGEANP